MKFSVWKFLSLITICSLTLRLARVKYWGYSTQTVILIVLTKLTRKLSDLSINLQWTSLQAVLPEAAGSAEASLELVPRCRDWIGLLPLVCQPMDNTFTVDWVTLETEHSITP